MQHPHIADAAVIGIPDERWSESVKAIILREPYWKDKEKGCLPPVHQNMFFAIPDGGTGKVYEQTLILCQCLTSPNCLGGRLGSP